MDQCLFCKGKSFSKGTTSLSFERDHHVVVLRDIPATICNQCGEAYFDAEVAERVDAQSEKAFAQNLDVGVLVYQGT